MFATCKLGTARERPDHGPLLHVHGVSERPHVVWVEDAVYYRGVMRGARSLINITLNGVCNIACVWLVESHMTKWTSV